MKDLNPPRLISCWKRSEIERDLHAVPLQLDSLDQRARAVVLICS